MKFFGGVGLCLSNNKVAFWDVLYIDSGILLHTVMPINTGTEIACFLLYRNSLRQATTTSALFSYNKVSECCLVIMIIEFLILA